MPETKNAAYTILDVVDGMEGAREYLKKHIVTMQEEYWDATPFPHCNTARQIFAHLIATNRGVLGMLEGEPFELQRHGERHEEAGQEIASKSPTEILALYDASGEAIGTFLRTHHGEDALDAPLTLWGSEGRLANQLAGLSQETAYHTGQLSLIRQAIEPNWDYFKDVFGVTGF
ncbi:MAG: DUF664 domain-containing protein [Armatimonas sp.]